MKGWQIAVFLLIAALWGSQWLASQPTDRMLTAIEYGLPAVVLTGVTAYRRIPFPTGHRLWLCLLSGVMFLSLPSLLTEWAGERISAGLAVVVLAAMPLLAALLDPAISNPPITALVFGMGGLLLAASGGLSFTAEQVPGALAVLGAAVTTAWAVVIAKRELREVHPLAITALQLAAAAGVLFTAGILTERFDTLFVRVSIGRGFIFAIAGNLVALPLYYWLLKRIEPHQLTTLQWITALVAITESIFFLRARPSWRMLLGMAVIVSSVVAVLRSGPGDDLPLTIEVTTPRIED